MYFRIIEVCRYTVIVVLIILVLVFMTIFYLMSYINTYNHSVSLFESKWITEW